MGDTVMFHSIPKTITEQLRRLESLDARDRVNGTPRHKRLRQIPPETGRLLAILAANAPQGALVEIGTSAGYSTLYLALACRAAGTQLTTFEISEDKATLARETFHSAGVNDVVRLVSGDAREHLTKLARISFCFLDAEKDVYQDCYDLIVPRMVTGAILAADNVLSHEEELRSFVRCASDDPRVDSVIVPIGKGVLLCRRN